MSKESKGKDVGWPTGTLLLIGSCMAVFGLIALGRVPNVLDYVLYFESDMQFSQCLTSQFIHLGNPVQLIVCMVFLMMLGTLVETRVGPKWTITLFVGLGFAGSAIAQMALLDANNGGVSLGAATGVSGLAGLLLIWSPCFRVTHLAKIPLGKFTLPIWGYVAAWAVIDLVVYALVLGLGAASLFPHVIAFFAGAITGVILLKNKVLESEHQDLWTIVTGTAPGGRKERRTEALLKQDEAAEQQKAAQLISNAQDQLDQFLTNGQLGGALALLTKMADAGSALTVSQQQMSAIILGHHKKHQWEDSIPWLQQYLELYPKDNGMRLKLAQIFVVQQRLPGSAMEVLAPLEEASLTEGEEKLLRKIRYTADAMWEDDDIQLELQKRAW